MNNFNTSLLLILGTLIFVPSAEATHENQCSNLPTSLNPRQECSNRGGGQACNVLPNLGNPRQECNKKHLGAICNALADVSNPRQTCISALPPSWSVSVSSVESGDAGGNKVTAGRPNLLIVRGMNVGRRNSVNAEGGGFTVAIAPAPGCGGNDCLGVAVITQPNVTGSKSIVLRSPPVNSPHATARGTFQVVAPPVQAGSTKREQFSDKVDVGKVKPPRIEPDVAIVEVRKNAKGYTAVVVKNVGNAPTNQRCTVNASTFQYNPQISGPEKWQPLAQCFNDRFEFGVLLPGQSQTVDVCGYTPQEVTPGFWQTFTVDFHCGGETNDSNNHFSLKKDPDSEYFKSYGPSR